MTRRWLMILAIAFGSASGALWLHRQASTGHDWAQAPASLQGLLWPLPRAVAAFELLDQHSRPFALEQLRGHWSLLYFGYLQCPDVCPTTLQSLRGMQRSLETPVLDGAPLQFLFVSVDPGNDTPERIGPYLQFFGDDFIGLSGDPDQLSALANSVGVMYAEHIADDGTRSMDHSTSIVLVDPQGRALAALPAPHQPDVMAQQYRALRAWLE
ncbi:MAG: SCO family protein [Lysobacterales bacterium]